MNFKNLFDIVAMKLSIAASALFFIATHARVTQSVGTVEVNSGNMLRANNDNEKAKAASRNLAAFEVSIILGRIYHQKNTLYQIQIID